MELRCDAGIQQGKCTYMYICIYTDMSDVSGENCVMVELSRESAQIQIQIWVILCEVRMVRWWT